LTGIKKPFTGAINNPNGLFSPAVQWTPVKTVVSWSGSAKSNYRPFEPLVESSNLSALTAAFPISMPSGMLMRLFDPGMQMLPIGAIIQVSLVHSAITTESTC
jgi:hypothetical protein